MGYENSQGSVQMNFDAMFEKLPADLSVYRREWVIHLVQQEIYSYGIVSHIVFNYIPSKWKLLGTRLVLKLENELLLQKDANK